MTMNHPSKNMMLDLLAGKLSGKKARDLHAHIEGCNECMGKFSRLAAFLEKAEGSDSIEPPEYLLDKIIATRHELFPEKAEKKKRILNKKIFLPAGALAGAACAVFFVMTFQFSQVKTVPLSFDNNQSGSLEVDAGKTLNAGILSFNDIFRIELEKNSSLVIRDSYLSDGRYRFKFNLEKGSLLASFDKKTAKEYSFITPTAEISSTGTKFKLKVLNGKTEVHMLEGKVLIKSLSSKQEKECVAGKIYTVEKNITARNFRKIEPGVRNPIYTEDKSSVKESPKKKKPLLKNETADKKAKTVSPVKPEKVKVPPSKLLNKIKKPVKAIDSLRSRAGSLKMPSFGR